MLRCGIAVAAACFVMSGKGTAATIDLEAFTGALEIGLPDTDQVVANLDSASDGPVQSVTSSAAQGASSSIAQASVDTATGTIKTRVETSFNYGAYPAEASGAAQGRVSERISISGSGAISALVGYDGFWSVLPYYDFDPESYGYQSQGAIRLASSRGVVSTDSFGINREGSTGTASGLLEASIDVFDGDTVDLSFRWLSQISQGLGVMDFSNTATLSIFATEGVSLRYSDAGFLSASAPLTPIPLPGGAFFLLTAFGVILSFGSRKRAASGDRSALSMSNCARAV